MQPRQLYFPVVLVLGLGLAAATAHTPPLNPAWVETAGSGMAVQTVNTGAGPSLLTEIEQRIATRNEHVRAVEDAKARMAAEASARLERERAAREAAEAAEAARAEEAAEQVRQATSTTVARRAPVTTVAPTVATTEGYPGSSVPPNYIKQCESGGNYQAVNPNGHYGAWQFSQSTWEAVGGTGRPDHASPAEQDFRASILWNNGEGAGNWACA